MKEGSEMVSNPDGLLPKQKSLWALIETFFIHQSLTPMK